jgi:succinyl-CoA synthetase alpha subunit
MHKPVVRVRRRRRARPSEGHAGAVIAGDSDTATAKLDAMESLGLYTVRNPADIGTTVARAIEESGAGVHARAGA